MLGQVFLRFTGSFLQLVYNHDYVRYMITTDAIWDFPTLLVISGSFAFLSTKPEMLERRQMAPIPLEGERNWPFAGLSEKWKVPESAILLETSGLKIHFTTDLF